jgi:ankyrin repeat protein
MANGSELIAAVKQGDLAKVGQLLQSNPGLASAKDDNGLSAVLLAIYYGQPDIAKRLARDRDDLSIFESTALGKLDRIEELVKAIPESVNAVSTDGFTPLGYAAYFGHLEAARMLLEHGANPNVVSKNDLSVAPLHSALAGGQTAIALLLIEKGANTNLQNGDGWTPLHYAADIGDAEIANLLIEIGADHALKNNDEKTAAMLAVDVGHEHVADVIFEAVNVD